DPDRPDEERLTKDLSRLRAAYEEASPVFGPYRLAQVVLCHGRPKGTDYIREKVKDLDTPKMLLVGTRGDPATPYHWTEQTAKRLGP
ncbi:alpha/beta hydrolase, partial [Pseudomonas aeruginosa]